jgi:hypothetical protein
MNDVLFSVLPKFEVSFDLPSYGRTTDPDFEFKVTAT